MVIINCFRLHRRFVSIPYLVYTVKKFIDLKMHISHIYKLNLHIALKSSILWKGLYFHHLSDYLLVILLKILLYPLTEVPFTFLVSNQYFIRLLGKLIVSQQ